jgi:hypothetical protein
MKTKKNKISKSLQTKKNNTNLNNNHNNNNDINLYSYNEWFYKRLLARTAYDNAKLFPTEFQANKKIKLVKKLKYIENLEKNFIEYLRIKPEYKYLESFIVEFKYNKNKIELLINFLNQSIEIFVTKFNDTVLYENSQYSNYAIRIEINKLKPNIVYIANINKFGTFSGSDGIQLALTVAKMFYPKKITIFDAATIEIKKYSFKHFPLSLSRLLTKEVDELSWYNRFGFSLNAIRMKNKGFEKEKIHDDLIKLRNTPIAKVIAFFTHIFDDQPKKFIYYSKYEYEPFYYNYDINKDISQKGLESLFEILKSHKDLVLKDFLVLLNNKEKVIFYNFFFLSYYILLGILKDKKFIPSPFYQYLYILKFTAEDRELILHK